MEDLKEFNNKELDIKKWINKTLKNTKENESVEMKISNLIIQFQHTFQESHNIIDQNIQTIQNETPRILSELQRGEKNSSKLLEKLMNVQEGVDSLENNINQSFHQIWKMDQTKSRLENCLNILKNIDKVTKIRKEIQQIFQTQDHQSISNLLFDFKSSLNQLKNFPQFGEHFKEYENKKKLFISIISPIISKSLIEDNLEITQKYYHFLEKLDSREIFDQEYSQMTTKKIISKWNFNQKFSNFQEFYNWLFNFYNDLLSMLLKELEWFNQISTKEEGYQVFHQILENVFKNTNRQIGLLIESSILQQKTNDNNNSNFSVENSFMNKNAVDRIISLVYLVEEFAKSICKSFNLNIQSPIMVIIFQPFIKIQEDYKNYEKMVLLEELNSINLEAIDFKEITQLIRDSVLPFFQILEKSFLRCLKFSGILGIESLIQVLNQIMLFYFEKIEILIKNFRTSIGIDKDIHEFGKTINTWKFCQESIKLLNTISQISERSLNFEKSLKQTIISQFGIYFGSQSQIENMDLNENNNNNNRKTKSIEKMIISIENLSPTLISTVNFVGVLILHQETTRKQMGEFFNLVNEEKEQLLQKVFERNNQIYQFAHRLVFDTLYLNVKISLSEIRNLKIWMQNKEKAINGKKTSKTISLPTFSSVPIQNISDIGEHLLLIPHQLEPFALISGNEENAKEEKIQFINQWLNLVVNQTLQEYAKEILSIRSLSQEGIQQLNVDISYLNNVLRALGMPTSELLLIIQKLIVSSESDFQKNAIQIIQESDEKKYDVVKKMILSISKKRGLQIDLNSLILK
ncbi:conserved oligomeric golgi complex component 7 [Anaeramoeba ignava]|uniref:Conserved oligomeric Golgi complex subunit 7 n=1 Tax=Anaeramoeba ignava TaxID=1746090 RepID=A0A9Q0LHE2_ANAIG|nr:conserved oligomeric golgi complex component 7 [Anaeramoeba ignava]